MKTAPSWYTNLALCVLLCCAAACGDDSESSGPMETPPDATGETPPQNDTGEDQDSCTDGPGLTPVIPDLTEDPDCTLEGTLEGTAFVVNGLILTRPENDLTLQTLNPLWSEDIENGRLMLLFKVSSHDSDSGTATVRAGSGCYGGEDVGFEWHVDPTDLKVQVTGCHFETTEPSTLSIWPASMNKAVIVSDLMIAGHFTPNASAITGAFLEGALAREDAEGLVGTLGELEIPILDFFEGAGIDLDVDLDGDATPDAWGMAGDLSAEATNGGSL